MTAQTARTNAARKRTGPKQMKKQISAQKKHASARHSGKDAKLTSEPRSLSKTEKQNKRDATLRERANGKAHNHLDEQAANRQVIPNSAPHSVSERKDRASANGEHGHPAPSHDPQQGMQLKERLDDAIPANGAGLRLPHPSMLPMQAIAMAHWKFWATAMAVYPRAWISASSPWLDRR